MKIPMKDVIRDRVRIGGNDLKDYTNIVGLLQFRAPNRYRKLMPVDKEKEIMYLTEETQNKIIAKQNEEFEESLEWRPIGMGATVDNDYAIQWELK